MKYGRYLLRVRLPAGTKMYPHRHPEDRIYTVICGVFYIGLGGMFDENKLTAHSPGSVLILPGGHPHFHWAKSGEYHHAGERHRPLGTHVSRPGRRPANSRNRLPLIPCAVQRLSLPT
jgi:hypothetical protein